MRGVAPALLLCMGLGAAAPSADTGSGGGARGERPRAEDVETAYQRFDRSVERYVSVQEALLELEPRIEASQGEVRARLAEEAAGLRAELRAAERRALSTAGEYLEGRRASGEIRDIDSLRGELLEDARRLLLRKDFKNAIFSVEKAIRLGERDPAGRLLKAEILLEMGLHRSALAEAKKVLELDSENAPARKIIAVAQLKSGRVKQAVDAIARVLTGKSLFGTDGEAWRLPEEDGAPSDVPGVPSGIYIGTAAAALAGFLISGLIWRRRRSKRGEAAPARGEAAAPAPRKAAALDASGEEYLAGKYELTDIRDYGKASQVWIARDHVLNRPVTVRKVLVSSLADGEKAKRDFIANAKRIATLRHPNVEEIFEVVEEDACFSLVGEALDGWTLQRRVEKQGALDPGEAAAMLREVCSALSAAHAQGLLHRSLCPEHIRLTGSGHVKVLDFGGTRILGEFSQSAYLPPEEEAENPTTAYDVYSLGAAAYFALSGKPPMGVLSLGAFPKGLGVLLERALEPDRTKRIQTVKEFADEFQNAESGGL